MLRSKRIHDSIDSITKYKAWKTGTFFVSILILQNNQNLKIISFLKIFLQRREHTSIKPNKN